MPGVLLAAEASEGVSAPLLVVAAIVALAWLGVMGVVAFLRRPPRIHRDAAAMDLPPVSPSVAGLLAADFVVPSETAPAILLDLAARRVVDLDEVQPGRTICRVRGAVTADGLTSAESRVLDEVRSKAIDGVVPTDALTTGPEEQSKSWHRALARDVVREAQGAGLTRDRWPARWLTALGTGLTAAIGLVVAAVEVGGDTSGDRGVVAAVAGGIAGGAIAVGGWALGRMGYSLAQLPTDTGTAMAARVSGLEAHLHEDALLGELPPAAVKLRGRHFAYAAAFGVAPLAVSLLPMGAEDDRRAWSRFGGRWHRVRVRYPRGWPPGWGKHPAFATLLGVFWGAIASVAIYGLAMLAGSDRPVDVAADDWDWVIRIALILLAPSVLVLLWSISVLLRSIPDLWARRTVTGDIVRDRRFRQWFSQGDDPDYWYYLAIDDGTNQHVTAWRMRQELWQGHAQGETVTAEITPRLRYVRSIR